MHPPPLAIPPRLSRQRQAALTFLTRHSAPLLCLLFALIGLALAGDYGINYDEWEQRQIAQANLAYLLGQANRIAPDQYHDRVYGIAFELPLLLAERIMGLEDYRQIHRLRLTLTHLLFILGAFFCYRLAWRLSHNRLIALCALLLYLLHPRLYAHSYINSKDLPFLSIFTIALYLLERAFRRDTMAAFALLGLAVGLLINLRIMGIMLFPAVIALRGLDLFHAGNWPERRNILLMGGMFITAAGLTLYALSPYAWTNPLDYLAASLALTVNHPTVLPQLFQGRELLSSQLPPHYFPVWFAITTPPLILLLGFIGAAAILARCLTRPAALFRNTRRRFLLLLLACFLLPALAAALLTPNSYQDWRHLYFLYAPFSLLAALGGGGLLTALHRRRPWPAATGGLAALGLTLVALQMAQIHPWPHLYFNFLVNRTAPEQLRTQYDLDYWTLAARDGLEYLLQLHPDETLTVRVGPRHLAILPPADRQRLLIADGRRRADYALTGRLDPSQPDAAFNSRYPRRLYNNTVIALRPLDSSRMTPAAIAAYQDLYRQATAGQPIIQADYAVYRHARRLTFVKENCRPEERAVRFEVKFFPADRETRLSPFHKYGSHARFSNYPVRLDDFCLAVIQLPPSAAAGDLIVSKYPDGPGYVFPQSDELHSLSQPRLRATLAARRQQNAPPANPNAFALFLEPAAGGHPRLLYAKANCAPADYETPVFLHIYPANPADLPPQEREQGFANRDFLLPDHGGRLDGECIAVVPLPDYPIAALRTGQLDRWSARRYPAAAQQAANYQSLTGQEPPAAPLPAANQASAGQQPPAAPLPYAYRSLTGQEPDARAPFNLYWQDNLLIYHREPCAPADTAANFFLHITPQDTADLPRAQRPAGFANQDFPFNHWGDHRNGRCLALVPLPNYPIQTLRTGQQPPGQKPLWSAELTAPP